MREIRFILIVLSMLVLAYCNSNITGPDDTPPPPIEPPPIDDPEPPEPPRVDQHFSWDSYVGFSAFAATGGSEENTQLLYSQALGQGFNTARVCAEVRTWDRHGLPAVPADIALVDKFLDTTARIPGAQVLLNCICNMKEDGASKNTMRIWVNQIVDLIVQKDYKHVALSPGNELWHPASSLRNDEAFMRELIAILRRSGRPVTMDWNAWKDQKTGTYRVKYPTWLRGLVDMPNLHPWRNPDPNRAEIAAMSDQNGGRVLISEPTAYGGGTGGCCTLDREQIKLYACRAKREHVLWTYHSREGLEAVAPYSWFPNWYMVCN